MTDSVSRRDLLKRAGLVTGGTAALSMGLASSASAVAPAAAFLEGYVQHPDVGTFLVQAVANNVPDVGTGAAVPLAEPGRGFDVDFGTPVALNNSAGNKGRNPSWCLMSFTNGALTGFPPINSGLIDAIRLEGSVVDAADPTSLGVPVKVYGSSGLPINGMHPICVIKFFFGDLPVLTGRGLAFVNL